MLAVFPKVRDLFYCCAKKKVERFSDPEILKTEIEKIVRAIPEEFSDYFNGFKERSFERIDQARPGEMKKIADRIATKELIPCLRKLKPKDFDHFPKTVPPLLRNVLETERFLKEVWSQEKYDQADAALTSQIRFLFSKNRYGEAARLIRVLSDQKLRKIEYFYLGKIFCGEGRRIDVIEAMELDPEMESEDKGEILAALCRYCVEEKNHKSARFFASKIEDPVVQSTAEGFLVNYFLSCQDLDAAIEHAEKMKDPSMQSRALHKISVGFLQKQRPLQAQALAEKIPQDSEKSNALLRIFDYFKERSQFYLAYFTTRGMQSPLKSEKRADLLLNYLSWAGGKFQRDIEGLLKTIFDPNAKTRALIGYFNLLVQKKQHDLAFGIAERIPEGPSRRDALKKLFSDALASGKLQFCHEIISTIPEGEDQSRACSQMINKVLKTHQFPRALGIADEIKDRVEREREKKRIKKEESRCLVMGEL
jgi:hypothetical protein